MADEPKGEGSEPITLRVRDQVGCGWWIKTEDTATLDTLRTRERVAGYLVFLISQCNSWLLCIFIVIELLTLSFHGILSQTGEETFFKIKKSTKMQKVFETYAQRKGVQVNSLRFMLDGERIDPSQTPKMLELDDQDQIDCLLEQVGGR